MSAHPYSHVDPAGQVARDQAAEVSYKDPLKPTAAERAAYEQARDAATDARRAANRAAEAAQGAPTPEPQKVNASLGVDRDPTALAARAPAPL